MLECLTCYMPETVFLWLFCLCLALNIPYSYKWGNVFFWGEGGGWRNLNEIFNIQGKIPRSTFSKGLPLANTMFSPACLKASAAVHSAGQAKHKRGCQERRSSSHKVKKKRLCETAGKQTIHGRIWHSKNGRFDGIRFSHSLKHLRLCANRCF